MASSDKSIAGKALTPSISVSVTSHLTHSPRGDDSTPSESHRSSFRIDTSPSSRSGDRQDMYSSNVLRTNVILESVDFPSSVVSSLSLITIVTTPTSSSSPQSLTVPLKFQENSSSTISVTIPSETTNMTLSMSSSDNASTANISVNYSSTFVPNKMNGIINGDMHTYSNVKDKKSKWSPVRKKSIHPFALHDALRGNRDLSLAAVQEIVKLSSHGSPCSTKSRRGQYPIHIAITSCQSDEVITYLAEASRATLREFDDLGYLPIHYACFFTRSASLIAKLVELYPESLMVGKSAGVEAGESLHKYMDGSLPIHVYCHHKEGSERWALNLESDKECILFLAEKCPQSLLCRNNEGLLPLHMLCKIGASDEIIVRLASICPESLTVQDHAQDLPIHHLFNYKDIIRETSKTSNSCRSLMDGSFPLLVDMHPKSLLVRGSNGLVFHTACCHSSADTILYLAELCPESVLVDVFTSYRRVITRTDISEASKARVLHRLIRENPSSVHVLESEFNVTSALGVARLQGRGRGEVYRILLNSDPAGITDSKHLLSFRALNYEARRPALSVALAGMLGGGEEPWMRVVKKIAKGLAPSDNTEGRRVRGLEASDESFVFLRHVLSFL